MSTDLEQRLHDELLLRARRVGAWPGAGAHVRRVAAERRARRLRAGTALGAAAAVLAVVLGISLGAPGRPTARRRPVRRRARRVPRPAARPAVRLPRLPGPGPN